MICWMVSRGNAKRRFRVDIGALCALLSLFRSSNYQKGCVASSRLCTSIARECRTLLGHDFATLSARRSTSPH
jgi:hypothetical protein